MSMDQVVIQQPRATQLVQEREWSTDLFGCCSDVPRCLLVACFPPCYLCHMYKYSDEACYLPLCGVGPSLLRVKHRFKHNIKGTLLKDVCASMCCTLCVMCQLKADMEQVKNMGM
ncbi:Cornifelin [Paragonimus heterotremus]|uniref:Cornifelin n=1 Tax=Paragonimus heterotremus TaxID=100268 RepID=A0A8J4SUQ9_9TREM|nr:Cornifelin [Paragonimus heterotremus]